jgi:hypothetical protein
MADAVVTRALTLTNSFPDNNTRVVSPQVTRNLVVSGCYGTNAWVTKSAAGPYTLDIGDGNILVSYAGNYVITLPAANTALIAGKTFRIKKSSSAQYSLTINRAGSDTIDGATSIVLWSQYSFIDLTSDGSSLWVVGAYPKNTRVWSAKTTTYPMTESDDIIQAGGTSSYTVTLPAVANMTGRTISIIKTSTGAYTVTLDGNASETINGALTLDLITQYSSISLFCDGTAWYTI